MKKVKIGDLKIEQPKKPKVLVKIVPKPKLRVKTPIIKIKPPLKIKLKAKPTKVKRLKVRPTLILAKNIVPEKKI